MFGISTWELVVILAVALVVLGPRQLVETARYLGSLYRQLQRMTLDIRNSIDLDESLASNPRSGSSGHTLAKANPTTPEFSQPGEPKSGPDFYAQLLEQSSEDTKASPAGGAETKPGAPPAQPVDHTKETKG